LDAGARGKNAETRVKSGNTFDVKIISGSREKGAHVDIELPSSPGRLITEVAATVGADWT
jgi:hypothetical protein